jgi:O6-methylguanine-DNA--protein-cysteine methyltransferase
VLGSDRKLTGYAAGLDKKIELLKIENITAYR